MEMCDWEKEKGMKAGGNERERGEGEQRVKEKVVKLEGWGERVTRRRGKQREVDERKG